MIDIDVVNVRRISGSTEKLKNIVNRILFQAKSETSEDFVNIARAYPPESEANSPPPPYWNRGIGRIGSYGGTPNPPSQNLGASWSVTHSGTEEVRITNPVTYAPWVHGNKKQAWFHKLRGWKTVKEMFAALGIRVSEDNDADITSSDSIGKMILDRIASATRELFS